VAVLDQRQPLRLPLAATDRQEAAAAAVYRELASQCQDPELKRLVESQAQECDNLVQQFMGFLQG